MRNILVLILIALMLSLTCLPAFAADSKALAITTQPTAEELKNYDTLMKTLLTMCGFIDITIFKGPYLTKTLKSISEQ